MRVHQNANLAGAIRAVSDIPHVLLIDVEIDCTAARDDGQEICLAGALLEAGRGTIEQIGVLRAAARDKEIIAAAVSDAQGIDFGSAAIGAKHQAARVSRDNRHLHLHCEIAEVGVISEARQEEAFRIQARVIRAATESATAAALGRADIPVARSIEGQRFTESRRAARG